MKLSSPKLKKNSYISRGNLQSLKNKKKKRTKTKKEKKKIRSEQISYASP